MDRATVFSRFNPRAPRGRDFSLLNPIAAGETVSIHAPLGGATFAGVVQEILRDPVSIHAPLGGATLQVIALLLNVLSFNPRAPRGRDVQRGDGLRLGGAVSIHAPLGGATCSASSREAWRLRFNPRAPRGRDVIVTGDGGVGGVSIHAPLGGATEVAGLVRRRAQVSIHAPLGGATPDVIKEC